jgi:hypothetical protein
MSMVLAGATPDSVTEKATAMGDGHHGRRPGASGNFRDAHGKIAILIGKLWENDGTCAILIGKIVILIGNMIEK